MTQQWQLMRDAQTFSEASRRANSALKSIHFVQIARKSGRPPGISYVEKIDDGIKLLEGMLATLEARETQETVSSGALSILYAISQKRLIPGSSAIKQIISASIEELQKFKQGESDNIEEAENLLEIIASSAGEEAMKASARVRVLMMELSWEEEHWP